MHSAIDCAHGIPINLRCGACEAENMTNTVSSTLSERGSRYGDFTDHARISQEFQQVMQRTPNWERLDPVKKEGLILIVHKIARALNGDPEYQDNYHDIQGYARLIEERCATPSTCPVTSLPCHETPCPVAIDCSDRVPVDDAIEPQKEAGWIIWYGGACPVHPTTLVDYKMRCSPTDVRSALAGKLVWSHNIGRGSITSYRVSQ